MREKYRSMGVTLPLICALWLACPGVARGSIILFSDQTAFSAVLNPGSYLETFQGLPQLSQLSSTQSFSGGAGGPFTYNAVARDAAGLYAAYPTAPLTTFQNGGILGFDFLSNNVTAVGGNFFSTDANGAPNLGAIWISFVLWNGTAPTPYMIPVTSSTSFFGVTSNIPIMRLDLLVTNPAPGNVLSNNYATAGNLQVGAVPEPGTFGLVGAALILIGCVLKRRG